MTTPKAPTSLSASSRKLWRTALEQLQDGAHVPLDLTVLRRCLEALDRAQRYEAILDAYDSPTHLDDRGVQRRRPEAILARQQHADFLSAWQKLVQSWQAQRRLAGEDWAPGQHPEHLAFLERVRPGGLIGGHTDEDDDEDEE